MLRRSTQIGRIPSAFWRLNFAIEPEGISTIPAISKRNITSRQGLILERRSMIRPECPIAIQSIGKRIPIVCIQFLSINTPWPHLNPLSRKPPTSLIPPVAAHSLKIAYLATRIRSISGGRAAWPN